MENRVLKIQEYLRKYGLEKTVNTFKLKTRVYENKTLFKYDQLQSPTMMALPELQECRGLILENDTWNVISMPFKKFFNSEEMNAHKIDWNTASILEKLDGSMIQVYWDWTEDKWCAGTTGTADGEGEVNNKNGTTFSELFWNTLSEKYGITKEIWDKTVITDNTYIFELCTPYNIVVKPHGVSSITLLGIRDLSSFRETLYEDLVEFGDSIGIPVVKAFDLNATKVGDLIRTFSTMPWSEEGYVVVDANFNRIKVKNPAYVAIHHLKDKTAEHNILTIVKTNEIEEFGASFPERREELFELKNKYDSLVNNLNIILDELVTYKPKNITREEKKKFAEGVFKVCQKYNLKEFTDLFFEMNNGKCTSIEEYISELDNKKLWLILK